MNQSARRSILGDLRIEYADLPDTIAFRIGAGHYYLRHITDGSYYPYKLYQSSSGGFGSYDQQINITNINEWIYQASGGHHSYESVLHLAQSFEDGKKSAYKFEDLVECSNDIYALICEKLFHDGYAGRFADQFDIECMSQSRLKDALHDANLGDGTTEERQKRFVHVCEKNGYTDLGMAWQKVITTGGSPEPMPHTTKAVELDLRRQIEKMIKKKYDRRARRTDLTLE